MTRIVGSVQKRLVGMTSDGCILLGSRCIWNSVVLVCGPQKKIIGTNPFGSQVFKAQRWAVCNFYGFVRKHKWIFWIVTANLRKWWQFIGKGAILIENSTSKSRQMEIIIGICRKRRDRNGKLLFQRVDRWRSSKEFWGKGEIGIENSSFKESTDGDRQRNLWEKERS